MKLFRYVVLADRLRGFDTIEEARCFAQANVPSVICERLPRPQGGTVLVEILRHDFVYDAARREWRIMFA
ncbi:MAG: hypothetical protein HY744_34580 [Deltaproteobacteria bacterium]|nr:hypothetical protein [Deltaproteobacteria bacterium]